jgi:5-formyltetrahydrofolate cyclo-ligase
MDKATVRASLRETRRAIADRPRRSVALWSAVVAHHAWMQAGVVMLYLSFGDEPETSSLIAAALHTGKTVVVPRVDGDDLVAVPLSTDMARSAIGVHEPTTVPIDPATIDLVIVPGLAFTPDGHRIGYGRGYYDRFLAALAPATATIGACFQELLLETLPLDPWDHPVHLVISN